MPISMLTMTPAADTVPKEPGPPVLQMIMFGYSPSYTSLNVFLFYDAKYK